MNRSMLALLVVVACGLSQGCVLHNNRIVGSSMSQASDWYGELGVTGHLNRVEVKSPSDLTKLSILGDGNVIYVQPRVTLGKVEVWGANNKIYVPARLIIRSNLVGHGSEIIRLAPGQYVNLKGVKPRIEGTAAPQQAARWDRYGRTSSSALPERYVYTVPRDGAGGSYALTPAYTDETGTGVYEADAGSPATPDAYRYSSSDTQRYDGYTLQPTYESNIGSGDYTGQPQIDYANRMSETTEAPAVASDASSPQPATTYTTTPTASGSYRYDATPRLETTGTVAAAPPDPASSSAGSTYTTYDAASYTTTAQPATTTTINQPVVTTTINQPVSTGSVTYEPVPAAPSRYGDVQGGGGMVNPDPPGTYSGDYSNLGTTGATMRPIEPLQGGASMTIERPATTGGSFQTGEIRYETQSGAYAPAGSYQPADGYQPTGVYGGTTTTINTTGGTPTVNAPATTSTGLIAPQDYRGTPGSGIGTYVTPDGYQIRTQSGVVTSTGTSAPQAAQPSGKPVVVEDYP